MVGPSASRELLLADLEHFEESIWRSEEVGEKRFNFFLTLVTAVAGGLVALWSSDHVSEEIRGKLPALTWQSSLVLLIFGLVTYRRMIHRDRVTAEYKVATHRIRQKYKELFEGECPELRNYRLPLEDKKDARQHDSEVLKRLRRISQFGYTQTLAILNGILSFVVCTWSGVLSLGSAVGAGALVALVLCLVGSKSYEKE